MCVCGLLIDVYGFLLPLGDIYKETIAQGWTKQLNGRNLQGLQ